MMINREFHLENEKQFDRRGPVRWIASHLAQYPWLPAAALAAAVINNFAASYIQLLIGRGFDLLNAPGWTTRSLGLLALTVFLSAATQGLSGLGRNASFEFMAQRVERDGRDELYASLLGKSQTFHNRQRIGDIMARATNDVRTLNVMFSPGLMLITDSLVGLLAPVVLIYRLNPQLLLVPFLFIILFVITIRGYSRRLAPVSEGLRDSFGVMNAGLAEAVSGIEVVKGNAQEAQEGDKFITNASIYRDYAVQEGEIQARYLPMLVFSVCWGLAFLHAMLLWNGGQLTLGEVVSYVGLFGFLRFPTFVSVFSFQLAQLGIASARRILELINTRTDLDANESGVARPIEGMVEFRHVRFGYGAGDQGSAGEEATEALAPAPQHVLKDITFSIKPGETVAIVGQTGSGKSTLTRLINRIFDADSGQVLVDGIDVRDWNLESLRSQISTIEQDVFLFSRTVAENIAFGVPDATREDIERAAREAQAHDFIMSFDHGYETEVGERGVALSGGQRQRIAIARAFLTNPRILILDDSTSAIDSATEDRIQQAMYRISQQRTTFLITHRLSQIRWADRILVLKAGEIVDQGTHEELLEQSADYRRIFARYD
ncbi:MAG: ABC transporter ATP-binding protein [Anaerolineales bacterium]|uniref:ABC transporter ATP-binding protein n=1 Tax=Promineifilum sp. TaxID=2664178 RepID=UPI001D21800B|nr:ABC transporter ATP-binding protein [Anaerolineales bacterium]MCO5181331.1 ABC transporter ATP-binding protein/permease [Promineifilum sp.]